MPKSQDEHDKQEVHASLKKAKASLPLPSSPSPLSLSCVCRPPFGLAFIILFIWRLMHARVKGKVLCKSAGKVLAREAWAGCLHGK